MKRLVRGLLTSSDHDHPTPDLPAPEPGKVRRQLLLHNHKLQPAEVTELVHAYRAGQGIASLGRLFTLHQQTVRAHLVRANVPLRPVRVLSVDQLAEAAELYRQGWSTFRLGAHYEVSPTTVRNNLKALGMKLRPRGWAGPRD